LHWARVAFNVAASVSIFVGFLKFYRYRIIGGANNLTVENASNGRSTYVVRR
jgi:hypothetical protein